MGSAHSERKAAGACEVEDLKSGQRYLMYRLPAAALARAPRFVYECSNCHRRCEASSWTGGCPSCRTKHD